MEDDRKTREATYASDLFMRIREDKRDRVIQAAVRDFAAFGYAGANVNRIAREAGISVGSLYKYFPSKNDLFMFIVDLGAQIISRQVNRILEADIRLSSKLERLLGLARDYSFEDPDLIRLYLVFSSDVDQERAGLIADRLEAITARAYRDLFQKAQERGEVRQDIDPGILALLLDNQLLLMQFAFASPYHDRRLTLFVGRENVEDREYLVRSLLTALESMFEIRP